MPAFVSPGMYAPAVTMLDNWEPEEILRSSVPLVMQGAWRDASLELVEVRKQRKKRIAFAEIAKRKYRIMCRNKSLGYGGGFGKTEILWNACD